MHTQTIRPQTADPTLDAVPSLDAAKRALRRADRATLDDRAVRVQILHDYTPDGDRLFAGGTTVLFAYQDAQHAYLNGMWLATILTALTALHRHMAARLHMRSINPNQPPMQLIRVSHKLIDPETCQQLTEAFAIGGFYSEVQDPGAEMTRSRDFGFDTERMVEHDARIVLATMMEYFAHYCTL